MADERDDDEMPEGMAWWAEVARQWGPAILVVLVIRTWVFEPFRIPSGSMLPTLLVGDFVVVNKASYGIYVPATVFDVPFTDGFTAGMPRWELIDLGDPERGDIIVFRYPRDERLTFIKRVVGLPGDRISIKRNQVILDDQPLPMDFEEKVDIADQYCRSSTLKQYREDLGEVQHAALMQPGGGSLSERPEVVVPEGHVMVLGDNRDNSEDSRAWGFVRYDQIKGKAHFVWMSWDACSGNLGSVRSERLFHNLYQ